MWNKALFGTDLYHIVHWFFIYSILGWLVESIYMSICNRKVTNRGFIKGPICPIYGIGALSVFFLLRPFAENYIVLYFAGAFVATILEFFTAIIMIRFFGSVWWDYNDKPFNYKGILCLESTIAWGFYTVCLFLFLQRIVEVIVNSYSFAVGKWIGVVVLLYFLIDFSISLYRAKRDQIPASLERFRESIRGRLYR